MKCAWCNQPGAIKHVLMSKQHLSCNYCYLTWYDDCPASPEKLVELSLKRRKKDNDHN